MMRMTQEDTKMSKDRQNEHNCAERKDENGVRINGVVRQNSGVFVQACKEKGLRKVGNNQSSVSGTLRGLWFLQLRNAEWRGSSSVLGALFLYLERCSDKDSVWDEFIFLQRLGLSFIDHHNILAVTAISFFCILPEKVRSPAWTAVRRIFHHRNRSLLLSHKCSWR